MIIIDRVVVRNIYHTYRLIDAGAVIGLFTCERPTAHNMGNEGELSHT
ncbi:MAG TPA: hypothetical protein VMW16_12230 [Sedimentisphaerales bacterium]|nr:hypothetical protein [Sedimentisphaerales bacterium]